MKKTGLLIFLLSGLLISSCNRSKNDSEYIKKVENNEETIAVGIYKATGFDYPNLKYIAEALKIDGGIVYVTLTDADVLKTKLENIDVLLFPAMSNNQNIEKIDDEIANIITSFIDKKGNGAIAICNGAGILSCTPGCPSLDLMNVVLSKNSSDLKNGIVDFTLTESGQKIFPELEDYESLYINLDYTPSIVVADTSSKIKILGEVRGAESNYPVLLTSQAAKGRVALINASPETTPGMRWIIPRLVRWVENKEYKWYGKNVMRPTLYSEKIALDEEKTKEIEELKVQLDQGKKDEVISAIDQLYNIYPWAAAEKVRSLLIEKNDDIKLRAAKYLVDIEYTLAIDDLNKVIKKERSKKVREQLVAYRNELDAMLEQN